MRRLSFAAALLAAVATGGAVEAADVTSEPQIFTRAAWICRSPEEYERALQAAKTAADVEELGEELLEKQLCLYLEYDDIEDIFAPFVQVLEQNGDLAKVSFTVEFYRRVGGLGGRFSTVKFTGWTALSNLEPYY